MVDWATNEDVGVMAADDAYAYVMGPNAGLIRRFSRDNPDVSDSRILELQCTERDPKLALADDRLYINLGCIGFEVFDLGSFRQEAFSGRAANTNITAIAADGDPTREDEEQAAVAGFDQIWQLDSRLNRTAIFRLDQVECDDPDDCLKVPWLEVVVDPLGGGAFETTVLAVINEELGPQLLAFHEGTSTGPVDISGEPVVVAERIYVRNVEGNLAAFELDLDAEPRWTADGISPDWPVIVEGQVLYAVDGDQLYTLNSRSGTVIGEPVSLPAAPDLPPVFAGGAIVIACSDQVVAVEPAR